MQWSYSTKTAPLTQVKLPPSSPDFLPLTSLKKIVTSNFYLVSASVSL